MASLFESLLLYMPVVSVFTVTTGPDTLLVLVARWLRALSHDLERPGVVGWLDRTSGALFIAFGLRLALG